MFLAAAVQMRSGTDRAANEARALSLLGEAADRGAALIGLPEMWEHIGPAREKHAFAGAVDGPQLARIRELCSRRSVFCLAGSIAERAPDGRVYNTSALVSPRGEIVATYRKLHLFDVDIPDGARYRESEQVAPGSGPVVCTLAGVRTGLEICYDVRFGELSRALAAGGAELIVLPAAWAAGLF